MSIIGPEVVFVCYYYFFIFDRVGHWRVQRTFNTVTKILMGDIYVGVVGPVRTGKSTFIKRFMDLMVIPNIENAYKNQRKTV